MNTGAPLNIPKTNRGQVLAWVRAFFLAVAYILLIPVVSVAVLWAAVTYFPEPTKNFLGPIVEDVLPSFDTKTLVAQQVEPELSDIKGNLAKIRDDVVALSERLSALEKGSVQMEKEALAQENGSSSNSAFQEIAHQTRLLAALSSLTAARMEYLQGNKGLALREIRSTQDILADIQGVSQEFLDMLKNCASEISKDSPEAQDWLSLSWHRLLEDLTTQAAIQVQKASK